MDGVVATHSSDPGSILVDLKGIEAITQSFSCLTSFIGACVEPHQIILITEFCSKGALQDILENLDIKLEMMFVASLTSDLGLRNFIS